MDSLTSVKPENKQIEDDRTEEICETTVSAGNSNTNNFNLPNIPEECKESYETYISEIEAFTSIPIIQSITPEHIKNFKHFNMRYYEDKYYTNFNMEKGYNDVLIRIHSNKLFLVALASGNDIIRSGKKITGINFMINNIDRSDIKLGGKRKKGAKLVENHTILCQVKCEGIPKMFNIRAGVPGRIIEINELVKTNPNLLIEDPRGNGFLAVMAPKGHPSTYEKAITNSQLLNQEEYTKYLTERTPKFSKV